VTFEVFVRSEGPRLRAALVAAFGAEVGADATADALSYGWEHWDRVETMENRVGYLFRVGQNVGRRARRPSRLFPPVEDSYLPRFEPGLLPALAALSEQQRIIVVLVHGYGWSMTDVAALLDVSHSTIRTHIGRALSHLQKALEVDAHAD